MSNRLKKPCAANLVVTVGDILMFNNIGAPQLQSQMLPVDVSFHLGLLIRRLAPECQAAIDTQRDVFRRLGGTDNGSTTTIKPEDLPKAVAELEPMLQREVTLSFPALGADVSRRILTCDSIKLSPQAVASLLPFLAVPDSVLSSISISNSEGSEEGRQ